ncbi:MAG TPA: four-carbon acid sugar kinase family protein [Trueperaceae bacterium]
MGLRSEPNYRGSEGRLRLAFYGDDFTGSTDSLEALVWAGVRSVLFTAVPTSDELSTKFPRVEAIGVAGDARAMSPAQMEASLPEVFGSLAALRPEVMHYKVCSTYDSSPALGNIGVAARLLAESFGREELWALGGAPHLGRYLSFGHLFARYGGDGLVYRIDRHPVMSHHPSTPMLESDLRAHLLAQWAGLGIGNVIVDSMGSDESVEAAIARVAEELAAVDGPRLTLFDAVQESQTLRFAAAVERRVRAGTAPLLIGPSSVEGAMASVWNAGLESASCNSEGAVSQGAPSGRQAEVEMVGGGLRAIAGAERLLVLSGSCSPMTELQVRVAERAGFSVVDVSPRLGAAGYNQEVFSRVAAAMEERGAVIAATCRGGGGDSLSPDSVGELFAELLRNAVELLEVKRAVIAGGDSSSKTVQRTGIRALEMIGRLDPGVPLCRAYAPGHTLDGIELALKGGQLGGDDLFVKALRGVRFE